MINIDVWGLGQCLESVKCLLHKQGRDTGRSLKLMASLVKWSRVNEKSQLK